MVEQKTKASHWAFHRGTNGEFIQGQCSDGTYFHVTFPITLGTQIGVERTDSDCICFPEGMPKIGQAARETLSWLAIKESGLNITRNSKLPVGKGMGSSTADIIATSKAVAGLFNQRLNAEELAAIATKIEISDGTMFDGVVCFATHKGELMATFPWFPPLIAITLELGITINTSQCVSRTYDVHQQSLCDSFILEFSRSMEQKDLKALGQATTRSADLNQSFLPFKGYSELKDLAKQYNAIGISIAHTGSLISILFAEKDLFEAQKAVAAISDLKIGKQLFMFKPNANVNCYELCFEQTF